MVEKSEVKIIERIHFWTLTGPLLALVSFAILLYKVSDDWYFPVCALLAFPLCAKWKAKGLIASLLLLAFFAVVYNRNLESDEFFWYIGMTLATGFSFVILTLSFGEVDGLLGSLKQDAQNKIQDLLQQAEQIKVREHTSVKESLDSRIAALSEELTQVKEEKMTFHKLAELSQDELLLIRGQHEKLLQDLMQKKQHISQLLERIEETESTIHGFISGETEQQQKEMLHQLTAENRSQKTENEKLASKLENLKSEKEYLQKEEKALQAQLNEKIKIEKTLQSELNNLSNYKKQLEEIQQAALDNPKDSGKSTILYAQLKRQFEEKSAILDETRKELFHSKEQLEKVKKEHEEENYKNESDIEIHFNRWYKETCELHDEYEKEITLLSNIIKDLISSIKKPS